MSLCPRCGSTMGTAGCPNPGCWPTDSASPFFPPGLPFYGDGKPIQPVEDEITRFARRLYETYAETLSAEGTIYAWICVHPREQFAWKKLAEALKEGKLP